MRGTRGAKLAVGVAPEAGRTVGGATGTAGLEGFLDVSMANHGGRRKTKDEELTRGSIASLAFYFRQDGGTETIGGIKHSSLLTYVRSAPAPYQSIPSSLMHCMAIGRHGLLGSNMTATRSS